MPDIGLPEGATIAYYAKSGAIPNGWAICDGTNNTPAHRAWFVPIWGAQRDVNSDKP